ncbi:MAG: universal stress protein [Pseudomonadales bacterium]|nr:universal stress protein [Pseudomonadales bacterium]
MLSLNRILVAVEQDDTARFVVEKAAELAQAANAELHIVRVIYDANVDASIHDAADRQQLKTYLMEAEESWLQDFLDGLSLNVKVIESATIWNKDEYAGILDAARDCEANLVVKAAHQPHGLDAVMRTPQDWNLLRHAEIPVMIVKSQAWKASPVVLAAIDVLHEEQETLNRAILREAAGLTQVLEGELDVVVAHPFVQPWIGPNTVPIDFDRVKGEIESEIRTTVNKLADEESVKYRYLHIEEGTTAVAVGHQVDSTGAELLVMGTVARDGLKGLVLGNTSETILYHVQSDVVVLR